MRIAAIDIGTNTVLLLVAEVDDREIITPIAYEQRIPRLGKDVDARRVIGKPAFERVAGVLREYKAICEPLKPDRIAAVGTSAVRDAANREEFVSFIKAQTGIGIEILNGEEEARLAYFGALSGIRTQSANFGVIDIGGGSTEIVTGTREDIRNKITVNIGSVQLTERFLRHDPPTAPELEKATKLVAKALGSLPQFDFRNTVVVGVAGTATTLAALDQGLKEFDREKITGYRLTKPATTNLFTKLQKMKTDEIRSLSAVTHGRADILTAGTLILYSFMERTGVVEITVSERGVRYGLVLREWRRGITNNG